MWPLVVAAVLIFALSGTRPLMARYAEAAREMASEGHWLVPHVGGSPHLTKPPLTYWLVAVSIRLFGHAEWATRLPIGLCAVAVVALTGLLGRAMFGERAGLWAAWFQALAVVPLGAANVITTDTPLTLFETAIMLCAWQTLRACSRHQPWALGFYAALGCAFLTKGPAGWIPLAGLVSYGFINKSSAPWRRLAHAAGGALLFILVLGWPLAVMNFTPNALQIWGQETIQNVFFESNHAFPRLAYPLLLVFGSFPGTIGLVLALGDGWRERFRGHRDAWLFLGCWVAVSLFILGAQRTRLPLYILPLFPPISVIAGWGIARRTAGVGGRRLARRVTATLVVTGLLFLAGKWYYAKSAERKYPRRCFREVAALIQTATPPGSPPPRVYIEEGHLGYGLMYYLRTTHLVRLGKVHSSEPTSRPRSVAELLRLPRSQEFSEFVLLERSDDEKLSATLQQHGRRIGGTAAYTVWKLN